MEQKQPAPRDAVPPQCGVMQRHEGRVTSNYAVCKTCDPPWSMRGKSENHAARLAAAHSFGKHGWTPDVQ